MSGFLTSFLIGRYHRPLYVGSDVGGSRPSLSVLYDRTNSPSRLAFASPARFGEEIISHCPEHRDPKSITDAQRHAFRLIKQASALADADLRDPDKHDEWLHKWHEHSALCASRSRPRSAKPYKTLRGFVIAAYRSQLVP